MQSVIRVREGICRLSTRWEEIEMFREDSWEEGCLFDLRLTEMSEPAKKMREKHSK